MHSKFNDAIVFPGATANVERDRAKREGGQGEMNTGSQIIGVVPMVVFLFGFVSIGIGIIKHFSRRPPIEPRGFDVLPPSEKKET